MRNSIKAAILRRGRIGTGFHVDPGGGEGPVGVLIISAYSLNPFNQYVDVFFDPNVYAVEGGALQASDLQLVFSQNGGTATDASISTITQIDGSALAGGENVIRLNFTLTGDASGVETIEIKSAAYGVYKNSDDELCSASDSTGPIQLEITYSDEYQAIIDYAISQGIDYPLLDQRIIDNTLVLNFKSLGAWTETDILYVMSGDRDEAFAKLNWKSPGNYTLN